MHKVLTQKDPIINHNRSHLIYSQVSSKSHDTDVRDNYKTVRWAELKLFANVRKAQYEKLYQILSTIK